MQQEHQPKPMQRGQPIANDYIDREMLRFLLHGPFKTIALMELVAETPTAPITAALAAIKVGAEKQVPYRHTLTHAVIAALTELAGIADLTEDLERLNGECELRETLQQQASAN